MEQYTDELYTILDDMNSQIEDMINNYDDPGKVELVISALARNSHDFVDNLQAELEKIDLIEAGIS